MTFSSPERTIQFANSIDPSLYSSTQNGDSVDTLGWHYGLLVVPYDAVATAQMIARLEHSPDDSSWSNLAGTDITLSVTSQAAVAWGQFRCNGVNVERYVRAEFVLAGGTITGGAHIQLFGPVAKDSIIDTVNPIFTIA